MMVLGQFEHSIMHISGERNRWGDFLSRWINAPAVKVRVAAMLPPSEPDDTMPSKEVVRQVQQSAHERVRTRAHEAAVFMTPHEKAVKDGDRIFRIKVKGRGVM